MLHKHFPVTLYFLLYFNIAKTLFISSQKLVILLTSIFQYIVVI